MQNSKPKKQIVVLGAGFGGLKAALGLARLSKNWHIVLVDQKNYQVYYPVLHEVAASLSAEVNNLTLKKVSMISIPEAVKRFTNITFKQAKVASIDVDRRIVQTDGGDLTYDYLVASLGSVAQDYNLPGFKEHTVAFKSFEGALNLRQRIKELALQKKPRLVICGGGFSGVELAGELARSLKKVRPEIFLIEGENELLPGLNHKLSKITRERLQKLGVQIKTGMKVAEASSTGLTFQDGSVIEGDLVINTLGVKAVSLPFSKNVPADNKGRVIVGSRLNLESNPEIFVIGDSASWLDPAKGRALPQTAQIAVHQGGYVAQAIAARIENKEPAVYRPKKDFPIIVTLGGRYAALVSRGHVFAGPLVYVLRRLADLRYLWSVLPARRALAFWFKGSVVYLKND